MFARHLLQSSPWAASLAIPLVLAVWWGAHFVHRLGAAPPAVEMLSVSAAIAAGGEANPRLKHRRIGLRPLVVSPRILAISSPLQGRVLEAAMGSTDVARTDQPARTLRPGDRVTRGQVLARMWSPELGEKKSRFLAAFSRLMCDQEALAALQSRDMPAKDLAEAERHCQFDQVTLDRAESALRDLQFLDADLDLLRASALRLHEGNMDYQRAAHWAEWELRSPGDGVVVESRLAAGIAVECGSVLCVISTGDVLEARGSATGRDESLLVTASPIR